jgi:hypothetical protein
MTSSLEKNWLRSKFAGRKRLPRKHNSPWLETLEDRCVLAVAFQFSASVFQVANTQQAIQITVTKTGTPTTGALSTIDYSATPSVVAQPPAQPGVDFVPTSGTLQFGTETLSQSFIVTILKRSQNGPFLNPVFYVDLNLSKPVNGELGTPSQALLKITTTSPSQLTLTPFAQQAAQNVLLNAQLAKVQDAVANLQSTSYKTIVSWGDGTPLVSLPLQPQGTFFTVNGSHVYTLEGTYTFTVTVIPGNGPSATTTGTVVVGGFVTGLYNDLFDRTPDQAGLQFWDTQIAAGMSRQQVAFLFWNSPEHQAIIVQQFYLSFLGHGAVDRAGFLYWTNLLITGTSPAQVAIDFTLTPEFLLAHPTNNSFAAGVYLAVEGSLPSMTNVLYVQILNAFNLGLIGRADVTAAILGLPETYTNAVDQYYLTFLRRTPDAAGRALFTGEMLSGNFSPAFIGSQILGTPEYLLLQDAIAIGAIPE